MTADDDKPLVTIVGAGPGGLLLARFLQQYEIPVVVYEKETSADVRGQGGTLDLHEGTGLAALAATGLLDDARELMRDDADAMRLLDKRGVVYLDEAAGGTSSLAYRPEIDRTDLRNLLISSLAPGTIHWDHAVESVCALDNDTYEIKFGAQPSVTTNLLIGADGAFSRVRTLLHDMKPEYSGLTMFDMLIPAERMTPELAAIVGPGSAFILDDEKGIIPQMNAGGKCKVYAALKVSHEWLDEHRLPADNDSRCAWLASHFDGWDQGRALLMSCDPESIIPRRIYQFDPDIRWATDLTGVTVFGDAAHVMSPFAGEGVNQADAQLLGETLLSLLRPVTRASGLPFPLSFLPLTPPPSSEVTLVQPARAELHAALRKFERTMLARARPEMVSSRHNLGVAFGPNGARTFSSLFFWMPVVALGDMLWSALSAPLAWTRS